MKLVRYLFAVLIPPVGVLLTYGFGPTLLINVALTVLGYVPGIIHAIWAITKHDERLGEIR